MCTPVRDEGKWVNGKGKRDEGLMAQEESVVVVWS
jgi:hypothetical protein